MIQDISGSDMRIDLGEYEPGEMVNGKPISFNQSGAYTRKLLGWSPSWNLEDGLKETYK